VKTYGQFCPVAKASEIFAERWTPLIIRELLMGSTRFSALENGLPGIPRSLLVQRLRSLERAGVVRRHPVGGRRHEYYLTPAGEELFEVIMRLGVWGQRWVNTQINPSDVDPPLLMWDMHRRVNVGLLPDRRIVARFDFRGLKTGSYWLVLERPEPSVCFQDPGFEADLLITTDTLALHQVWMGHLALADAIRKDLIQLDGPADLVRQFPGWLALSTFADVRPARTAAPTA
jgi:DNA-binding HxlR family transcriptional regulator